MPAARQTVSMRARLAAAGLLHADRPPRPPPRGDGETVPPSARVSAAHSRARERVDRQRQLLRPLGWVLIAIVVTAGLNSHPAPGLSGARLGISVRTVNKHMQHIHARLGVPSRVAAVARTLEALLRSSPN